MIFNPMGKFQLAVRPRSRFTKNNLLVKIYRTLHVVQYSVLVLETQDVVGYITEQLIQSLPSTPAHVTTL